jgi:hypothetical protein
MDGAQLRFGNAIGPPKVERSRSFFTGALRLAPLHVLKYCVDFLLA